VSLRASVFAWSIVLSSPRPARYTGLTFPVWNGHRLHFSFAIRVLPSCMLPLGIRTSTLHSRDLVRCMFSLFSSVVGLAYQRAHFFFGETNSASFILSLEFFLRVCCLLEFELLLCIAVTWSSAGIRRHRDVRKGDCCAAAADAEKDYVLHFGRLSVSISASLEIQLRHRDGNCPFR